MASRRETIGRCFALLASSTGREVDHAQLDAYALGLAELTVEQIEQATRVSLQRCKFFPTIAELIEYAQQGAVGYEARALIAFSELDDALRQNKPSMMSPLTAAIVRQLGGFQHLYALPLDEFNTWKRREFLNAYVALLREHPDRVAAIAGERSELAAALLANLQRVPSRDEVAKVEQANREKLLSLEDKR